MENFIYKLFQLNQIYLEIIYLQKKFLNFHLHQLKDLIRLFLVMIIYLRFIIKARLKSFYQNLVFVKLILKRIPELTEIQMNI